MEHRKFLQGLDELVPEVAHNTQAQKVIAALQQRGEGQRVNYAS